MSCIADIVVVPRRLNASCSRATIIRRASPFELETLMSNELFQFETQQRRHNQRTDLPRCSAALAYTIHALTCKPSHIRREMYWIYQILGHSIRSISSLDLTTTLARATISTGWLSSGGDSLDRTPDSCAAPHFGSLRTISRFFDARVFRFRVRWTGICVLSINFYSPPRIAVFASWSTHSVPG
ncbi:hypothetical protein CC80DRAFT_508100 [Byssothecium circinans]|uniref:Uncharacterized protein n=1 Tax=Byssothecium circinans TaxID=147558 RepID=A0A6A5TNE4_9PLEO|nr:hypothetical protein CC80DRAFT_508100 [Byssothecium circinans]